tara:strand:+ start:374 stop:646 length:273 start_codon:yes stop_codon:yes gene_type:complete
MTRCLKGSKVLRFEDEFGLSILMKKCDFRWRRFVIIVRCPARDIIFDGRGLAMADSKDVDFKKLKRRWLEMGEILDNKDPFPATIQEFLG